MITLPPARYWIRGAVVVLVLAFAYAIWPTDVRRVERQSRKLLSLIGKTGPESVPAAALRVHQASQLIMPEAAFRLGEPFPTRFDKSELTAMLQQARQRADLIEVKNLGHDVAMQEPDRIALDMSLEANVVWRGERESMIGTYRLTWDRTEDGWRLSAAEVRDVIQHPMALPAWP